jgi:hypothetical protein
VTETARKRVALFATVGVLLTAVSVSRWPGVEPEASPLAFKVRTIGVYGAPPLLASDAESARVVAPLPAGRIVRVAMHTGIAPAPPPDVAPIPSVEAVLDTPSAPALLVAELTPSIDLAMAVVPTPEVSPETVEPADRPGAVTRAFGVAGRSIRGSFERTGAALRQAF